MSSGSYFPPPVKRVHIDKRGGGSRPLGIPTVSDRIAQAVVKGYLEPELEKHFHPNSYGYRPEKSALDAVGVARERCWRYAWVLDLDIRSYLIRFRTNCFYERCESTPTVLGCCSTLSGGSKPPCNWKTAPLNPERRGRRKGQ